MSALTIPVKFSFLDAFSISCSCSLIFRMFWILLFAKYWLAIFFDAESMFARSFSIFLKSDFFSMNGSIDIGSRNFPLVTG